VGVASGGGSRQLTVWEGLTRRHGARSVVKAVGEGLDGAVRDDLAMASKAAQGRRRWRRRKRSLHRGGGGGRPL
jgi:hypothetical protein